MVLGTIGTKIIVKREDEVTQTESGILLAESAVEKPNKGFIFLVGDEVKSLKEKDLVYFGKYAGSEIKFAEQVFIVLKEEEVLAYVRSEEAAA
jgi:chaperonin GroES